jgi:1-aminocyclopropane-1-carboxylate deaminase/D-cysteine desulfhydrase-like pyridoxal-dependent ACC family enzyme
LSLAAIACSGAPAREAARRPQRAASEAPATTLAPATTEAAGLYATLSLPHRELGRWPSPVPSLDALAREIGAASLHIKRDDQVAMAHARLLDAHGLPAYAGGKLRKLELLLGDAIAQGKRRVVTIGGVGSHHALATAVHGRALGLEVSLLLLPEPPTRAVCMVLLNSHAAGAELSMAGSFAAATREAARMARDPNVASIPTGGSSPLGNVAFVAAALELKAQIDAGELDEPDAIYIPLGTMGSAVGLAIGLERAGLRTQVVAVRASNRPTSSWAKVAALHADTVAWLVAREPSWPRVPLRKDRLVIEDGFLGAGYALPTAAGARATAVAKAHGIDLDDTYTAKAFAALLARERGAWRRVLFWHTHAGPVLDPAAAPVDVLPASLRGYCR